MSRRNDFSPMLVFTDHDDQHHQHDCHHPLALPLWKLVILCFAAMLLGASVPFHLSKSSSLPPSEHSINIPSLRNFPTNSSSFPKIAWLLSFPNSGTSYTLSLVMAASNMSAASNYAWEVEEDEDGTGGGEDLFPGGPHWLDSNATYPSVYALTKTHCGGYCHSCRPHKSVETPHSFLMHCAMAEARETVERDNTTVSRIVKNVYDYKTVVDRAVHLIRSPMDNMVSRYHLGVHKVTKANDTELMERYTYDPQGFANFCEDTLYLRDEETSQQIDQAVLRLIQDVPCHLDLFRYIQWHNLAFIVTDDFLSIPTHILYYEDYSHKFDDTLNDLLEFLQLPNTGAISVFEEGKSYREYYTDAQVEAMRNATWWLASPTTWRHVEHYFD